MRKILAIAGSILVCFVAEHRAQAQMAVFDSSNFVNTLQAMQTAASQLNVLNNQLAQLRQTYQQLAAMQTMFTTSSNVTGMFPNLTSPLLQNPMPVASSMPGQVYGSGGSMSPNAQTFFNLNHTYTATGTDAEALYLNRAPVSSANVLGMAATNLQSIEQRLASLSEMQTELQGAADIKQVTAINGRIAIESNAIQGQQAQAQNLAAMASAQAQADQQSQLQTVRQGHEQAAAMFTATLLP